MTQRNINYTALYALGLVLLLGGTMDVQAQTGREFQLHGFSSWGYGKTNGNLYLMGSDEGEYSNVASAISLSASPYNNLAISSQVEWLIEGDEVEAELDYVFATLKVSDAFALNFGRVKHPFGIYTQIYDVGTLRPFFSLPQGIYGGSGFVAEGYNGVGISGASFGDSWGLTYHVYGGALNVLSESPFELFEEEDEEEEEEEETIAVTDVLGGRVVLFTPVDGLSLGVSGYSGSAEHRHTVMGGHVEYLSDHVTIRSEYATGEVGDAFYLEAAYNSMIKFFLLAI